jgi:Ammonium Transporter Family
VCIFSQLFYTVYALFLLLPHFLAHFIGPYATVVVLYLDFALCCTGCGFFVRSPLIEENRPGQNGVCNGLFYRGSFQQLGVQLVGVLVISAFTGFVSCILFYSLHFMGFLRVARNFEMSGLDRLENAPPAYPDFVLVNGPSCVQEGAPLSSHTSHPHHPPSIQLGMLV